MHRNHDVVLIMLSTMPQPRYAVYKTRQQLIRTTTNYPESGLDNVQLINVAMCVCSNGHQELQIPPNDSIHACEPPISANGQPTPTGTRNQQENDVCHVASG